MRHYFCKLSRRFKYPWATEPGRSTQSCIISIDTTAVDYESMEFVRRLTTMTGNAIKDDALPKGADWVDDKAAIDEITPL